MGTLMTIATVLGPERKRRWTKAQKAQIVAESLAGDAGITEVARRHDVHPNLLHAWRRQARRGKLVCQRGAGTLPADDNRFSPVVIAPEAPRVARRDPRVGGSVIEVQLRNGRILRVPEEVAAARVALLADVLEGESGR
jgi:transposase